MPILKNSNYMKENQLMTLNSLIGMMDEQIKVLLMFMVNKGFIKDVSEFDDFVKSISVMDKLRE